MREIGKYLNTQYIIYRDVYKTDKLPKETMYIQKLFDNYLDLKIKYQQLQQEKASLIEWLEEERNDIKGNIDYQSDDYWLGMLSAYKSTLNKIKGDDK